MRNLLRNQNGDSIPDWSKQDWLFSVYFAPRKNNMPVLCNFHIVYFFNRMKLNKNNTDENYFGSSFREPERLVSSLFVWKE